MTRFELALYQPDIPQNVGAAMRLCACLGVRLHVIEPCGFPWNWQKIKRAALDYAEHAAVAKHESWSKFESWAAGEQKRIMLLSRFGATRYTACRFTEDDILLLGRESAGVPQDVMARADMTLRIPMMPGCRSLNVINAGAVVLGEALRQIGFPAVQETSQTGLQ